MRVLERLTPLIANGCLLSTGLGPQNHKPVDCSTGWGGRWLLTVAPILFLCNTWPYWRRPQHLWLPTNVNHGRAQVCTTTSLLMQYLGPCLLSQRSHGPIPSKVGILKAVDFPIVTDSPDAWLMSVAGLLSIFPSRSSVSPTVVAGDRHANFSSCCFKGRTSCSSSCSRSYRRGCLCHRIS